MRVLVTGSTKWTDEDRLFAIVSRFAPGTVFVTGDTIGVDALVVEFGKKNGYRIHAMQKTLNDEIRYPDEAWKGLNERMIVSGISLVIALHPDLGKPGAARGTQHVIDLATAASIPVETYTA
jgi:hypothetical protein